MEEELSQTALEENENIPQQDPYQPRPWWQVWGARILAVAFIILVIMYYITVARGCL